MPDIDLSNRTDFPAAFDERTTLTRFLQYVRLTVHAKCVDLAQTDAAKTPLPGSPAMSITGLVSHLRWAEAFWIDVIFLGQSNQWPGTDDDSELQMRAGLERPLVELLDEYAAQVAHTDEVVASRDWDSEAACKDFDTGKPIALRYIVMRLIEETARHNGHLDILRELVEGVTGD
ncbi:MAG: DinB family protein [Mycobacteriaceae bacterium]